MRLLQDKEITVIHDCDQSECLPAEHSSPVVFIIFIIIYIFKRDFNYIHYIQFLTNECKVFKKLCEVCATAALNWQH